MDKKEPKLRCLVIDDDVMARKSLQHLIGMTDSLEWEGECQNAVEALAYLRTGQPDVLFLDVEMPEMSGLDLLDLISEDQQVVLISASHEYAVNAFDRDVTDYLLKPVTPSRFFRSINRLIAARKSANVPEEAPQTYPDHVFIKDRGQMVRVSLSDVKWIEALGDYIQIYTEEKRYTANSTMKDMLKRLPPTEFMRVHRSFIIRMDQISSMEDYTLSIGKKLIPVGKSYRKEVQQVLNVL